jgi:hypothetical protein
LPIRSDDVRTIGDSRMPHSRIELIPISSPYPLRMWVPAYTGSDHGKPSCGMIAVTPVRTALGSPSSPSITVR